MGYQMGICKSCQENKNHSRCFRERKYNPGTWRRRWWKAGKQHVKLSETKLGERQLGYKERDKLKRIWESYLKGFREVADIRTAVNGCTDSALHRLCLPWLQLPLDGTFLLRSKLLSGHLDTASPCWKVPTWGLCYHLPVVFLHPPVFFQGL